MKFLFILVVSFPLFANQGEFNSFVKCKTVKKSPIIEVEIKTSTQSNLAELRITSLELDGKTSVQMLKGEGLEERDPYAFVFNFQNAEVEVITEQKQGSYPGYLRTQLDTTNQKTVLLSCQF